jgi:hypothetical protein
MPEKRYLILETFSRAAFTPPAVRKQLLWLAEFSNGKFEPERCGV